MSEGECPEGNEMSEGSVIDSTWEDERPKMLTI